MPKFKVTSGGLAWVEYDDKGMETGRTTHMQGDVFEAPEDDKQTQRYLGLNAMQQVDDNTPTTRNQGGIPFDTNRTGNDSQALTVPPVMVADAQRMEILRRAQDELSNAAAHAAGSPGAREPDQRVLDAIDNLAAAVRGDTATGEAEGEPDTDDRKSYEDMPYAELQAEAAGRGLKAGGKAEDIIERLRTQDRMRAEATQQSGTGG